MPLSNSVIRRYTPPTCTLEILAQSSPLSHWMGKTVIKQLSFELRFDDPQLPEEKRFLIRGDRDQLEILCDAVTSYVQEFLQQPPENFWLSLAEPQDSSKVSSESEFTDFQQSSLPTTKTFKSFNSQIPGGKIRLEPGNYLTHNLFLGSLANQTSGSVIQLSLLQLFDLATALDEYSADVMALPNLHQNSFTLRLPTWAPIAAVMVLGVGLLPVTLQYANNNRQKQPQIAKSVDPKQAGNALESSPSFNFPTQQPGLTPPDDLTSLPLIGSDSQLPTASLPQQPSTSSSSTLSANSSASLNSGLSPASLPSPPDPLSVLESKIPNLNSSSQTAAPTTSLDQQIAIQPNLKQDTTAAIPQSDIALLQKRNLPPSLSPNRETSPSISSVPPSLSPIPNSGRSNTLPVETPVTSRQMEETVNSSVNTSTATADRFRNESIAPIPEEIATGSTLFDTPQIAEAREIFQKRWQPPSGFTQTLEYSLMVGVDGALERILPLNRAAREYVETAGIPEIGKPFVSANRYGQNVRIRVVLSPDGKVQTFSENE
ncbi:DUF4335 domain-containing protein [Nostocales cyanobacterium LEGE 11386]|nr:DUF4335 domain-containing protein [Nostocales cyanobacterium LEGE 11386]